MRSRSHVTKLVLGRQHVFTFSKCSILSVSCQALKVAVVTWWALDAAVCCAAAFGFSPCFVLKRPWLSCSLKFPLISYFSNTTYCRRHGYVHWCVMCCEKTKKKRNGRELMSGGDRSYKGRGILEKRAFVPVLLIKCQLHCGAMWVKHSCHSLS